jgi:hypothetical protein
MSLTRVFAMPLAIEGGHSRSPCKRFSQRVLRGHDNRKREEARLWRHAGPIALPRARCQNRLVAGFPVTRPAKKGVNARKHPLALWCLIL